MNVAIASLLALCASTAFLLWRQERLYEKQLAAKDQSLRSARRAWAEQREMYETRIRKLRAGYDEADPLPTGAVIENGQLRCQRRWLSLEDEAALEAAKEMH